MGIKEFADKAKARLGGAAEKAGDAADVVRDKVGHAAEAAVDKVDDMTGGKVPDSVKNVVDKIDGDGDDDVDVDVDGQVEESDPTTDEAE